jgi:hypothetical protein
MHARRYFVFDDLFSIMHRLATYLEIILAYSHGSLTNTPMSKKSSFWDHPIENIEEALHIRKQIDALQSRLSKLVDGAVSAVKPSPTGKRRGRPKMSATTNTETAPRATKTAAKKGKTKKKAGLTPEGRARLAASMKARWAARKKAAGQS